MPLGCGLLAVLRLLVLLLLRFHALTSACEKFGPQLLPFFELQGVEGQTRQRNPGPLGRLVERQELGGCFAPGVQLRNCVCQDAVLRQLKAFKLPKNGREAFQEARARGQSSGSQVCAALVGLVRLRFLGRQRALRLGTASFLGLSASGSFLFGDTFSAALHHDGGLRAYLQLLLWLLLLLRLAFFVRFLLCHGPFQLRDAFLDLLMHFANRIHLDGHRVEKSQDRVFFGGTRQNSSLLPPLLHPHRERQSLRGHFLLLLAYALADHSRDQNGAQRLPLIALANRGLVALRVKLGFVVHAEVRQRRRPHVPVERRLQAEAASAGERLLLEAARRVLRQSAPAELAELGLLRGGLQLFRRVLQKKRRRLFCGLGHLFQSSLSGELVRHGKRLQVENAAGYTLQAEKLQTYGFSIPIEKRADIGPT